VLSRYATTLAALVVALLCTAVPAAGAADVPLRFYGVNYDADIRNRAPSGVQDNEWSLMAPAGVETTRTMFSWNDAQPREGLPPSFAKTDPVVARAAQNGIELLPIVMEAPPWARENPRAFHSPPRNPDEYADYLFALVERYGPNGSFWFEHPELTKSPIRTWQLWNEPHLQYQWDTRRDEDYAPGYGKLLRTGYKALKQIDPGSTVVLAGLANKSWEYLDHLYRKGRIKGYFDVAAVHPYTASARGVITITRRFRKVMDKRRDGRKRLWITELGLPASEGQDQGSSSPLQTTDEGMASFLTRSYDMVIARRRSRTVRVSRIYWYTWASVYCCGDIFRFTGLRVYNPNDQTVTNKPAFDAYQASAAKHRR
jgi:hypothetical protein